MKRLHQNPYLHCVTLLVVICGCSSEQAAEDKTALASGTGQVAPAPADTRHAEIVSASSILLDSSLELESQKPSSNIQNQEIAENHFPEFGFSLSPPQGWSLENAIQPQGYVGRWIVDSPTDDHWSQFAVQISIGQKISTVTLASRWQNRGYTTTKLQLDRIDALRLDAPDANNNGPGAMPGPIFVAVKGSLGYQIIFLLDKTTKPEVADITMKSWTWQTLAPMPAIYQLGPPIELFGGNLRIPLPRAARQDKAAIDDQGVTVSAFDYVRMQDAFVIRLERTSSTQSDIEEVAGDYSDFLRRNTSLSDSVMFSQLTTNDRVWISNPIKNVFELADGREVTRQSRFGVFQSKEGGFYRVQCITNDEVFITEQEQKSATEFANYWFSQL